MSESPSPRGRRRLVESYGRINRARPEVFTPRSVNEVRELLAYARRGGRCVSFHAGGHSFDAQALNDDMIIDFKHLNRIRTLDKEEHRITVEAGVPWGKIVEAIVPQAFQPYVVVTTERATPGGTLSGNCLSRSSPIYGKEGKYVERFQLLTVGGELLECSRSEHADVFHAVIGGFGYLGAVLEITYRLMPVGDRGRVETVARKFHSAEALMTGLIDMTKNAEGWDAVYSTAFFSGDTIKGFVFRSRYTNETKLRPLLVHRPNNIVRIPIELLARFSAINNFFWNVIFKFLIRENDTYIDNADGYHFMMDGHRRAKEFAEFFGYPVPTIQQTFVMPETSTLPFMTALADRLRAEQLSPNLFDVLFVPADDMLMSANNGLPGYAVSVAFDDLNQRRIDRLDRVLQSLSDRCAALGGRVYLVKNVHATTEQLGRMYAHAIPPFLALKARLDPDHVLTNGFFQRVFGALEERAAD